jgi:23S rRNA (adenine2030-N6)-methyltransferase
VQRPEALKLAAQLHRLAPADWLDVSLTVAALAVDGLGLHGSGVFVFNPPWKLEASLREAKPTLLKALRQDTTAAIHLDFKQT